MTKTLTRNSSKTTRIVLTLVLALALILAFSAPAFAAATTGEATDFSDNGGQTTVDVEVTATNLSVTVPTSMTIVANFSGGECTVPETYAIVNKSPLAIKVIKIEVTDAEGGLAFTNTDTPATGITETKDLVSLALTPADGTKLQLTTEAITAGLGDFDITAATTAEGTSKGIVITAKSSMLSSADTQANAFTIKYTVAAGTTSAQQGE